MMVRRGAVETLGHPLVVAGVGAIFAAYTGYLVGQTTIETRLTEIEKQQQHHESQLDDRRDFMMCAIRHIDRLETKSKAPTDCQLRIER